MKQEELMLGDYVTFRDCLEEECSIIPIRIIEIRTYNTDVLAEVDGDKTYDLLDFDELAGIPITSEILEKNGFEKQSNYQWKYRDNSCKIVISIAPQIEIDGEMLGTPPINVILEGALFDINMTSDMCVHNLQQALHLCGIEKEIII